MKKMLLALAMLNALGYLTHLHRVWGLQTDLMGDPSSPEQWLDPMWDILSAPKSALDGHV